MGDNVEGLSIAARRALLGTNRQCIATSRNGERCGKVPMVGQFVCAHHGGKTPLALKAAKELLNGLREPALEVLYRATRNAPPCEHCGRSDADRDPVALKAAIAVLDRTGHHPSVTVQQVETRQPPAYFAWLPLDRLKLMAEWEQEALDAMKRGEPPADVPQLGEGVVDAEVVAPAPEPQGPFPGGNYPNE